MTELPLAIGLFMLFALMIASVYFISEYQKPGGVSKLPHLTTVVNGRWYVSTRYGFNIKNGSVIGQTSLFPMYMGMPDLRVELYDRWINSAEDPNEVHLEVVRAARLDRLPF